MNNIMYGDSFQIVTFRAPKVSFNYWGCVKRLGTWEEWTNNRIDSRRSLNETHQIPWMNAKEQFMHTQYSKKTIAGGRQ